MPPVREPLDGEARSAADAGARRSRAGDGRRRRARSPGASPVVERLERRGRAPARPDRGVGGHLRPGRPGLGQPRASSRGATLVVPRPGSTTWSARPRSATSRCCSPSGRPRAGRPRPRRRSSRAAPAPGGTAASSATRRRSAPTTATRWRSSCAATATAWPPGSSGTSPTTPTTSRPPTRSTSYAADGQGGLPRRQGRRPERHDHRRLARRLRLRVHRGAAGPRRGRQLRRLVGAPLQRGPLAAAPRLPGWT